MDTPPPPLPDPPPSDDHEPSTKDQVISLFLAGVHDVGELAMLTGVRSSYVGNVLQEAGLRTDYFDLYTSTRVPMNVYSRYFAGKLGFKDIPTAEASISAIDQQYRRFEIARDRAGQHHALLMALTMYNRARWTGKTAEAGYFQRWLLARLDGEDDPEDDEER